MAQNPTNNASKARLLFQKVGNSLKLYYGYSGYDMVQAPTGNHSVSLKKLLWAIISLGIILRLAQYLFNRSLWLDEVLLALNIIERTWGQLFYRLDYAQGAPIGFLLLQKALVTLFGSSEYALRFIPLLCGIFSLFLFCKTITILYPNKRYPSLIAVGLFSISERLIWYSSENKQYSSDVAITLLIFCMALKYLQSKPVPLSKAISFALIGAFLMWFSHPAVFVLAGVGISIVAFYVISKDLEAVACFSGILGIWALSFFGLYIFSLQDLSDHKELLSFWQGTFMPFPPLSLSDASWFVNRFFYNLAFMIGLSANSLLGISSTTFSRLSFSEFMSLPVLGQIGSIYIILLTCTTGFILLIGCFSVFKKSMGRWFLLISPMIVTLFASWLGNYPFHGRMILFLFPFFLVFIAEGADAIQWKTGQYTPVKVLVCCLLFVHPVLSASYYVITPRLIEEVRPAVEYLAGNLRDGDVLYVNKEAGWALQYYGSRYGIERSDYNVVDIDICATDEFVGHKRFWIMVSHIFRSQNSEIDAFLSALERRGRKIDSLTTTTGTGKTYRVSVYLYDLSPKGT